MIIVNLMGGLGNQMFQYAFGKYLSLTLHKKLILDKSFLLEHRNNPGVTPRDYELSVFSITEEPTIFDHGFGLGKVFPYRVNKFADPFIKKFKSDVVCTDNDPLEDILKTQASKIIINGYFQKEIYFIGVEEVIRRSFTFKNDLSGENLLVKNKIDSSHSVSLHVRRGDYVSSQIAGSYHGLCSPEYYKQAIKTLTDLYTDLRFFVFSDDIEWCRANLNIPGDTCFISHNTGANSYLDMHLMSLCKHNIIANSSFSWWGAWLNNYKDKVVIAPKKWFVDSSIDTKDLYPKNWLTL
ncbi:MAG: alpha-1,2-fucosyltransferase [Bacteroidota bacterium]